MKNWKKTRIVVTTLLSIVLLCNSCFIYLNAQTEQNISSQKEFKDLEAIVYGKNSTSQSNTGYSVSFHVDGVEGLGYIPCNGLTHDKKYTPVPTVEGSGLYKNGVLEKEMYLATFCPSGSDQMQFVISWQNTDNPSVEAGDVITIQGSFEHNHTDGITYVLGFEKVDFVWDGTDWTQTRTVKYKDLQPILYKSTDTSQSKTGYSVSFHVDGVEGLGYIPCNGLTHDKKYTPVSDVEGSGLYKNGILESNMYLATFCPSGSNQMQFVISWQNTTTPSIAEGDVIKFQGAFEHQGEDGVNYLLQFNTTEYIWDGSEWAVYEAEDQNPDVNQDVIYEGLQPILYKKGDTSQSSLYSVSFHVDGVEGIGTIPCMGLTHDKKYEPVTPIADSGIYRNGILDSDIYLATFYPSGSESMQFVISWANSSSNVVNAGDIICIQGTFMHQDESGIKYLLTFVKAEYLWDGSDWSVYDPSLTPPTGQTIKYENLKPILYKKNDTGQSNTGYSVSFYIDGEEGIGTIPCNGLTHDKKYAATDEGGLYKNGKALDGMYLATFCPSGDDNMQFVISWQNTSAATIETRDIITLQGSFVYEDENHNTYLLSFEKTEYMWDGNDWKVYVPLVKPMQNTPEELGYTGVNLKAFGIAPGPYRSTDEPNYVQGVFVGDNLNQTYLDLDLVFGLTEEQNIETSLRYLSANGWTGVQIGADEDGLYIQDASVGNPTLYTLEELGLQKMSEKFNFKFATKLGTEYDNGNGVMVKDITYSMWINDVLIVEDVELKGVAQTGNMLGLYVPKGSIIVSIPTDGKPTVSKNLPTDYRELTFKSFDIADGEYGYTGKMLPTVKGTTVYTMDKTLFSGDVYFAGGRGADLRYGGYDSIGWTGLQFYSTQNGDIQMAGVSTSGYVTDTYKFRPYTAGTELTDTWFNLKISMRFVDADDNGIQNDVELGVWFNECLYDNEYIYLMDYKQYIGDGLSAYVETQGSCIKVRSDKEVYTGVDFSLYGFTMNWKKELGLV